MPADPIAVAPINGRNSASHEGESGQIAGKLVGGRESEAVATPGKMEVSETSSTKIPVHAQREHNQTTHASEGKLLQKFVVKSGDYKGQSSEGKRQGKGVFKWANGQHYEGAWRNDMRNGIGTETWPDGRKYHGSWKNDAFEGEGVFTWADGTVFRGLFSQYCPVAGDIHYPSGEVYAVEYDGTDPIWDGSRPSPSHRIPVLDEEVLQDRVDKMYEALCASQVYGDTVTERMLHEELGKMSGMDGLEIDEIFIEALEGSDEVKVSFEVRRLSQDGQRPVFDKKDDKEPKPFGKDKGRFGAGTGMGRVSMEASKDARAMFADLRAKEEFRREAAGNVTAEQITEEIKPQRLKSAEMMYVAPSVIDGAGSVLDSDERIKQLIDELKAEQAGAQERRSNSIDAQRRGSGEAKRDGRNSGDAKRTSSSEFGRRKSTDNKLQRAPSLVIDKSSIDMKSGRVEVTIKKSSVGMNV